MHTRKYELGQL